MRVTPTLLAASLLGLPLAARAEDPAKADPFRPVQPAWPDGWSGAEPPPASEKPAKQAEDNEVFTFDDEASSARPVEETAEPKAANAVAPADAVPATTAAATPSPTQTPTATPVDLRTPHIWMVSGGALIGASVLAALAIAIGFDEPGLAGATLGIGGTLGLGGLTVGVAMQNRRLEAAGQDVAPALPSGLGLKVVLTR